MAVPVLEWVLLASALAFVVAAADKAAARRGRRRVPERVLLGLALAGGSLGLLAAVMLLRHKTRKPPFLLALVGILAVQAAAAYFLLWS